MVRIRRPAGLHLLEYRVWCRICAVEFLLPEGYIAHEQMGVRIPCPRCGDWSHFERREFKVAERRGGRPGSGTVIVQPRDRTGGTTRSRARDRTERNGQAGRQTLP